MRQGSKGEGKESLYLAGLIPVWWLALLTAPYMDGGLRSVVNGFSEAMSHPFKLQWCEQSPKLLVLFTAVYVMSVTVYESTARNYRPREEHGSARWGSATGLRRKYADKELFQNKILTRHTAIGLNGRKHMRNLNVLVVGGSGSGKTRSYAKPNVMQANTSFVVLDPKGEILRDTGNLLTEKGYEIKVLNLIDMDKSHCYNPFVYIHNDNDVQKLVTNIFKNTTPKEKQAG